jgi:secreted PhoX family phosphatase
VFRSKNTHKNSEVAFQQGTIAGEWVAIPGAHLMDEATLEAASDAADAMVFARPEDGAFNPRNTNEYFFVTTGGASGANVLGRLYSLRLNPSDPTNDATLNVIYNADSVVAAGGDIALSPDNIDTSGDYLMVQEDGTTESRAVMAAKGRDGSIWRFRLKSGNGVDVSSAKRVVELDPPGRNGAPPDAPVGPGVWETSGIIAGDGLFGAGSWLFDVQAHSPTPAPVAGTVEDGQLMLLTRRP